MATASIRPPAVAGLFYPADARLLHDQVVDLLARARLDDIDPVPAPKLLIVPHAGYIYSGQTAARAYSHIAGLRERINRVVLLGPAHRLPVHGFALPASLSFATPLGVVPLSQKDWKVLQQRDDVVVDDRPHAAEHCLEVQLPFLQTVLGHFELVPVLVGAPSPEAVEDLLDMLWGGDETLVVISSDLSHFHRYDQARTMDRRTIDDVMHLRSRITTDQACGAYPVNGALRAAARRGLEPVLLDLCNSGDTAGDRSSVVGYASVAFCGRNEVHAGSRH